MKVLVICADSAKCRIIEFQSPGGDHDTLLYFFLDKYKDVGNFKVSFGPGTRASLIGDDGLLEGLTDDFIIWDSPCNIGIISNEPAKYFKKVRNEFENELRLKCKEYSKYAKYFEWF